MTTHGELRRKKYGTEFCITIEVYGKKGASSLAEARWFQFVEIADGVVKMPASNRKRTYHIKMPKRAQAMVLTPESFLILPHSSCCVGQACYRIPLSVR